MKRASDAGGAGQAAVAPHAGAWIETIFGNSDEAVANLVAPHAGAWIETLATWCKLLWVEVAPHAGAWIETGW